MLLVAVPFRSEWLLVAINESSRPHKVVARKPATTGSLAFDVNAGRARMAFIDPNAWKVVDLSG